MFRGSRSIMSFGFTNVFSIAAVTFKTIFTITLKQLLPACDLRVIFKVSLCIKNYFNFKDKIKRELRYLLVHNFKCNSCNAEYIGKTKRHYRTRTSEHIGVSPLTVKCVKNNSQTSAVHDHMLFCKTVVCPEDFSILAKSSCNFKLEIQESILIKLLKLTLNKNVSSVPLYLF